MARVSPKEFQEKHARRLKAALDDMRAGIEKVEEAPGKLAAAKKDKMKARLVEKIDDGTWERRIAAVDLEEWKRKIINKGIPRVSSGVDEAAEKIENFASQLLPHVDAAVTKVQKLPDLTLEDSINRMTTFIREMAKFRKK